MGQLHNELLRAHEIRQAIKDAVESSEGDVNVERLGETLTPVIDIWSLPEWSFLREECRFTTQRDVVAAVAAQFGFYQVLNPAGSNQLVVLDGFWASTTANSIVAGSLTVTPRGATGTSFAVPLDGRWFDRSAAYVANLTISKGTTVGPFGDPLGLSSQTTGNFLPLSSWPPVILPPGVGFFISDNVLNEAMAVQITGRVRPARPGELG